MASTYHEISNNSNEESIIKISKAISLIITDNLVEKTAN